MFNSLEEVNTYINNKVSELLPHKQVTINISSRMTSCLGRCKQYRSNANRVDLIFNKSYLLSNLLNENNVIENTVLHEIAHAIVGVNHHHDYVWKRKHIEIGGNGNTYCNKNKVKPFGKTYIYKCKHCGKEEVRRSKHRKEWACGECCRKYNNNKFSRDYLLELVEVKEV